MSRPPEPFELNPQQTHYSAWRAELLAELALRRLSTVSFHKCIDHNASVFPYDYLVVTQRGTLFVVVSGFVSQQAITDVDSAPLLSWRLDADDVRKYRESNVPVALFLFDVDTDHGRMARLDTLPMSSSGADSVFVELPIAQSISKDSLEAFLESLDREVHH